MPGTTADDTAINSPTAWFAMLERARKTQDYQLADRAKRELERLGVRVVFSTPRHPRGSGRKTGDRFGSVGKAASP